MSTVRVSVDEVIPLLEDNFDENKLYIYSDISKFLKNNFEKINDNQIAGLISRMGVMGIFKTKKESGKRMNYIYQGHFSKEKSIKNEVAKKLSTLLNELNGMKLDVDNESDFVWLQSQINMLKEQIKSI